MVPIIATCPRLLCIVFPMYTHSVGPDSYGIIPLVGEPHYIGSGTVRAFPNSSNKLDQGSVPASKCEEALGFALVTAKRFSSILIT